MTDTQLPKLPDLGRGIYAHPTLGHLYDSLQVQQKMVAYASEAVRAALAAQGEPVGEVFTMEALGTTPGKPFCHVMLNRTLPTGTKLYTAPPAPAKPMDREAAWSATHVGSDWEAVDAYMRGIADAEAHHGITGKGGA